MIAWSSPGATVLPVAGAGGQFNLQHAVGAFLVCALLVVLVGVTGWFERVMKRMSTEMSSGLLAGVLAQFALEAFVAAPTAFPLVSPMLATYLLAKRFAARYAVVATLFSGVAFVIGTDQMQWSMVNVAYTVPQFISPVFRWEATVSLALPLFLATMASKNLPGVAPIRASGYQLQVSRLIIFTGVATLVLAPFGAFALNLSAITAAICMGPQAHPNPQRRYTAAVTCRLFFMSQWA